MSAHNILEKLVLGRERNTGGRLFGYGTTVPSDAAIGWAKGALFFDLDAAAGAMILTNEGTVSSAAFKVLPSSNAAQTLAGAQTFSGQVDHSGTWIEPEVIAPTAALTLTSAHYGKTIVMGSLCRKCTLPLAAAALDGVTFTFVNNHDATADATEQWIDTVSGDKINGGTTGIGIRGQSTADAKGDHIKLICDGADWWTISRFGTYAASTAA